LNPQQKIVISNPHLSEDIFYDVEISDPIDDDTVSSLTPADYIIEAFLKGW
jgi:hypothetical protein